MRRSFMLLAVTFGLFITAASAPSPLYGIFQTMWHFSAITLTMVFAIYALTLLVALLICGSLSDYIGRRPVLIGALVVEAAAMAVFALASSVKWLFAARLLQGAATGIATAVLSAGLLDTQPKKRPGLAPLVSSIVPVASLGIGALVAGLLVNYAPWPTHLVFWLVFAGALVAGVLVLFMPETGSPKPGWQRSLIPTFALPRAARAPLVTAGPSLVADWALVGIYLSLGPSLALAILGTHNYLAGGLVIVVLTIAGAGSSYTFKTRSNTYLLRMGSGAAMLGLGMTALAIASSSLSLLFVGSGVAGLGFGPAFTGALRSILSKAPSDHRAGLSAVVYIVSYLALGVPVILAGIATGRFGLRDVAFWYSLTALGLYAMTFALSGLRRKSKIALPTK